MTIWVFVLPCPFIVATRLFSYIDMHPAVFIDVVFAWRKIADPLPAGRVLSPMTLAYLYGFGWQRGSPRKPFDLRYMVLSLAFLLALPSTQT